VNHPKKLRAQQVVGVIAADDVTLEILPKIDGNESDAAARRSLVHMLAAVLDLDIVEGSLTDLGWQRDYLLEIVIRLFCDRLFEAFHRGLPRRYVPHEDDRRPCEAGWTSSGNSQCSRPVRSDWRAAMMS
jgi:5-methylcytosine-specific restriction enzyme subunit McrC